MPLGFLAFAEIDHFELFFTRHDGRFVLPRSRSAVEPNNVGDGLDPPRTEDSSIFILRNPLKCLSCSIDLPQHGLNPPAIEQTQVLCSRLLTAFVCDISKLLLGIFEPLFPLRGIRIECLGCQLVADRLKDLRLTILPLQLLTQSEPLGLIGFDICPLHLLQRRTKGIDRRCVSLESLLQ